MAKKKNSMALFEVISSDRKTRNRPELSVPAWMRKQREDNQPDADQGESVIRRPVTEADSSEATDRAHDDASARDGYGHGHSQGVVSTEGGRLTVSLNYVTCTVALLTLVLVLVVTFLMGRASARTDQSQTPQEPTRAQIGDGQGGGPGGQLLEKTEPKLNLQPGKFYLVIQEMDGKTPALKAEANYIVDYFKDVNIKAAVTPEDGTGNYVVLLLKPFDSKQDATGDVLEIHNRGKRYKATQNRPFDFSQKDAKGNFSPRFYKPAQTE